MNLTSLKSYLKSERPKAADYVRFLHLLLQGIGLHAVETEADDLGGFRRQLDQISEGITDESSADGIVLGLGVALHALEEYNRHASRGLKAYSHELKGILTMMAETITFLSSASQTGVEKLQVIEKNLSRANDAGDVRMLREKLSDCLQLVRNESVRVRQDAQARIASLKTGMARATQTLQEAGVPTAAALDATTGLPGRPLAEQAIATRLINGEDFVVAVLMADRLTTINGRFGRAAGDKALMIIAQQLAQKIEDVGQLMRWSGPGFIALTDLKRGMASIERRVKEIASARIGMDINTADRQTMVQLTCSWMLLKVTPDMAVEDIFYKIDNCMATHTGAVAS